MRIFLCLFGMGLLLIVGCDMTPRSPSIKRYFKLANVTPLYHYRIKSKKYIDAGEWGEETILNVSREAYIKLVNELKNKPFFVYYDSTQTPEFAYGSNNYDREISEVAFFYKDKILYERFDPSSWDSIRIILQEDSLVVLKYINY